LARDCRSLQMCCATIFTLPATIGRLTALG
jgi:hypothetical protein